MSDLAYLDNSSHSAAPYLVSIMGDPEESYFCQSIRDFSLYFKHPDHQFRNFKKFSTPLILYSINEIPYKFMNSDISKLIVQLQSNIESFYNEVEINIEINSVSEREAMGFKKNIIDIYSDIFKIIIKKLRFCSVDYLVNLLENKESHFVERIASGQILSQIGDPRIPAMPEFLMINGDVGTFGTSINEVDDIYNSYKRFGLQRNWILKELHQHKSVISSFKISRYPITNSQFRNFLMETNHPCLPTSWLYGCYPLERSNHPVYTITENDALSYCKWLSIKLDENVHLPTEKQWEFAACEGEKSQFIWGNNFMLGYANTNEISLLNTSPVGVFIESRTKNGVDDMHGNVEEFVSSFYEPYEGADLIEDDLFKQLGYYRIAKGGAFNRFGDLARISRRHGAYPSSLYAIGFRVAIS
jgi:toxoflavin biosynthesis protein ToxD